jgi:hypothetical protein
MVIDYVGNEKRKFHRISKWAFMNWAEKLKSLMGNGRID